MRRLIAVALAGLLFGAGVGAANAQTPQADACYGLTIQYQQNPNPDLIRIAQDVGCIVAPAPYGVYSTSPTFVQTVAVPYTVVEPVYVPVRGPFHHRHWHR